LEPAFLPVVVVTTDLLPSIELLSLPSVNLYGDETSVWSGAEAIGLVLIS